MDFDIVGNQDLLIPLLVRYAMECDTRDALERKIMEDRAKVRFADCVAASKRSLLVGELAKLMRENGIDIYADELFEQMREEGFLRSDSPNTWNMPTGQALKMGLLEVKTSVRHDEDGRMRLVRTTKVTGKGQIYFIDRYVTREATAQNIVDAEWEETI